LTRDLVKLVGGILVGGAAILAVLPACGGSAGGTPPASSGPAAEPGAPVTSAAPAGSPQPATQPGNQATGDLLAKGKLIFEKTAGGVGCAYCHGMDGKGAGPSGLSAPPNLGKSEVVVRGALKDVELMGFIKLGDGEIEAVVAYLQYLSEQP